MPRFRECLQKGQRGVSRCRTILESAGLRVEDNPGRSRQDKAAWDLSFRLGDQEGTIEVKTEYRYQQTGNIAIEFHNPRAQRPAGLFESQADYWGYDLGDDGFWLANTQDLERAFARVERVRDVHRAGDGNASVRLFRAEHLLPGTFLRLDELGREEVLLVLWALSTPKEGEENGEEGGEEGLSPRGVS